MATSSNFPVVKVVLWGVPIIALIVLIVLLILELMVVEELEQPILPKSEPIVIQPIAEQVQETGEEIEDIQEDIQNEIITNTEMEVLEEVPVAIKESTDSQESPTETEAQPESPGDMEREHSYIVEEGDNLWKIAKRPDVLSDAWKWKTILIQNRDKINYTIFSEDTGHWKVMIDPGKRLIVKPREKRKINPSYSRNRKKRYALQLMSLNRDQLETAIDIVKFLIRDGYYAYLYRTREKIRNQSTGTLQYFYRIRVGFYESENAAKNTGAEILERYAEKGIFYDDYWAVLPSSSELNGELIDFGIQRSKPWIIQISHRDNRADAINDLRILTSLVDFAYISQRRDSEGKYRYRVRTGFYETRKEANKALANIRKQSQEPFLDSEALEVHHIMESAPGQLTGETTLSKVRGKALE